MKVLCEEAGGKGGVIILEGPAGAQNAEERKAGAEDALAEFLNIMHGVAPASVGGTIPADDFYYNAK